MPAIHRFGNDFDITQDVTITIGSNSQLYSWPKSSGNLLISSTDPGDSANGVGLREVFLSGLDFNWDVLTETVILDGLTPVQTIGTYIRLDLAKGVTVGTGEYNLGTINITSPGLGITVQAIAPLQGHSQAAIYSVPRNCRLEIHRVFACAFKLMPNPAIAYSVTLFTKKFGEVWLLRGTYDGNTQAGHISRTYENPIIVEEMSDVEFRVIAAGNGVDVSVEFDGFCRTFK